MDILIFFSPCSETYFGLAWLVIELLSRAWSGALPEQRLYTFPSRTICGGSAAQRLKSTTSSRHKNAEHLHRLMRMTLNKLGGASMIIEEIIHCYSASRRVDFTYTDIQCDGYFFETEFDLSAESDDTRDRVDVAEFILHDYHEILKSLSVLHFIGGQENDSQLQIRIGLTENLLYEALCSMNIALRSMGYHGIEVSRHIDIERTTDMCDAFNLSRQYVRDLELFRLLKRVINRIYTRYSSQLQSQKRVV